MLKLTDKQIQKHELHCTLQLHDWQKEFTFNGRTYRVCQCGAIEVKNSSNEDWQTSQYDVVGIVQENGKDFNRLYPFSFFKTMEKHKLKYPKPKIVKGSHGK